MKKAAIIIDGWKLPIFKKTLDLEGYKYTQHDGPTKGLITLKIEAKSIAELKPIVEKMNQDAALFKELYGKSWN